MVLNYFFKMKSLVGLLLLAKFANLCIAVSIPLGVSCVRWKLGDMADPEAYLDTHLISALHFKV